MADTPAPAMSDLWPWTDAEKREAERRERQVKRRMGLCVYNRGTVVYDEPGYEANNLCLAGVDIRTVMVRHEPMRAPTGVVTSHSFPCNDRLNSCGATCASRVYPTRAEALQRCVTEERNADAR